MNCYSLPSFIYLDLICSLTLPWTIRPVLKGPQEALPHWVTQARAALRHPAQGSAQEHLPERSGAGAGCHPRTLNTSATSDTAGVPGSPSTRVTSLRTAQVRKAVDVFLQQPLCPTASCGSYTRFLTPLEHSSNKARQDLQRPSLTVSPPLQSPPAAPSPGALTAPPAGLRAVLRRGRRAAGAVSGREAAGSGAPGGESGGPRAPPPGAAARSRHPSFGSAPSCPRGEQGKPDSEGQHQQS